MPICKCLKIKVLKKMVDHFPSPAGKKIPVWGISGLTAQLNERSDVFPYKRTSGSAAETSLRAKFTTIQYLLKLILFPMTPYTRNNQNHLAEEFQRFENYLLQESRIAILKVQSWQFAMKTPEVGQHYQQEATDMVKKSLLSFVPNSFVLSEEGYYYKQISN